MMVSPFAIFCLTMSSFLIHGLNIPCSYAKLFFTSSVLTVNPRHLHIWMSFLLWPRLFIPSWAISQLFSSSVLDTYQPGVTYLPVSYFFAFSYCSWDSQAKNTGVVSCSLLQWTTFNIQIFGDIQDICQPLIFLAKNIPYMISIFQNV